jgi:RNA polymerase sigma factor (sigma-70 family)
MPKIGGASSTEDPTLRIIPSPALLVEEYGALVTSLCRSVFKSEEEAREAAQEAWIEVLSSLAGYRGESKFGTWLYTVVYRKLVRRRIENRLRSLDELEIAYRGPDFQAPDWAMPDLILWVKETCRECMKGVLFCLDSDARLVFVFRFVVELPYSEIAAVMGKTEEATRQIASRARRLVSNFLRGECGLAKPGAVCRCRNNRWIRATGVAEEFWRLSRMTRLAELYRNAKKVFPKKNFWEKLLAEESANPSREPLP